MKQASKCSTRARQNRFFRTDDPEKIIIHYKDAATAFNNIKKATIENKGVLNNAISTLIFKELQKAGIKTHYIETINDRDQICRRGDDHSAGGDRAQHHRRLDGPASGHRGARSRRTPFTTSATRRTNWATR